MNSTRTEMIGINKLNAALSACPYLCPYITENDRTPCWDGRIFVYYSEEWKKDNLKGTVPVQIKTSVQSDLTRESISFQVDMADIRAYYFNGGAFFFVIYINAEGSEHTIYYASLLPYDLNPIVNTDKGSHTFSLTRFPEGNDEEIMNAFALFLDNRPKQMSIISNGILTLEEMLQRGIEIDSFMFSIPNFGHRNPYDLTYLSSRTIYVYAKLKGLNIDIPIQRITDSVVGIKIPTPVSVNGIEFYPDYMATCHKGKISVRIGQSFTITGLESESMQQRVNFKIKGTLKQRITDIAFFAAILEYGTITIGGHDFVINDFGSTEREFVESTQQYYIDTQRMLDALGVNEDLDCDKITDKDDTNIRYFISAVLYDRHIGLGTVDAQITYGLFTIANLKIMILCHRDEQGYYSIHRFTAKMPARFGEHDDWEKGEYVDGPAYLFWQAEHFAGACNIDIPDILNSLTLYKATPVYCGLVNQAALEVLKGYDMQQEKNTQLLTLSEQICEWLIDHAPDAEIVIAKLNRLQTIARQRKLNIGENGFLYSVLSDSASTDYSRLGARILLNDYDGAREILSRLPANDETANFIKQPIMNLLPSSGNVLLHA